MKRSPPAPPRPPPSLVSIFQSLPDDQLQQVLSFTALPDLLSFSAVSRSSHAAASATHHLIMPPYPFEDDAGGHDQKKSKTSRGDGDVADWPSSSYRMDTSVSLAIEDDLLARVEGARRGGGGGRRGAPSRGVGESPVVQTTTSRRSRGAADAAVLFPRNAGARRAGGGADGAGERSVSLLFRSSDLAAPSPRIFHPGGSSPPVATAVPPAAVSESRIRALLGRFRSLRVLTLRGLSGLGDAFLPVLNRSGAAPSLVSLELHDVRIVRDGHRLDLGGGGGRLSHVAVTGTLFVSYESVLSHFTESRNLKSVMLGGCRSLHDSGVADIVRRLSPKLEELCLPGCSRIVTPVINCDALRSLELQRCTELKSLPSLSCPKLVLLDLSFDTALIDGAVNSSVSSCPQLRRLILKGCSKLLVPFIQSESLEYLDISLCSQLTSIDLNCRKLKQLEVRSLSY